MKTFYVFKVEETLAVNGGLTLAGTIEARTREAASDQLLASSRYPAGDFMVLQRTGDPVTKKESV